MLAVAVSREGAALYVAFCAHLQWEEKQNQDHAITGINS